MKIIDIVMITNDERVYAIDDGAFVLHISLPSAPYPLTPHPPGFGQASIIDTVIYVPVPAWLWIRPRLAFLTWSLSFPRCFPTEPCNCQKANTACINPVAPTGWPQASKPPEGFTGTLPRSGSSRP